MNCLKKQLLIISFALIVAIAIFLIFGSSIYHQCIPRYLWTRQYLNQRSFNPAK